MREGFILDLERVTLLLRVSAKYGARPLLRYLLGRAPEGPGLGERLRLAFEELGITYLKLGQFLTMRFDILPAEVCAELNRLFESVSPMGFETAKGIVESELKAPLHELFRYFEQEPIAAASVAQVHIAYTRDHQKVAVKIQRADSARLLASDMRNLRRLVRVIDALGVVGEFSAQEIADQFATWTKRELDFELEGRTADRLRRNAASFEIIPRIHWPLTTKRVLTMEFVEGVSLAKIGQMIDSGHPDLLFEALPNLNVEIAGRNIAFAVLRQLFVFGFFQGDPHPGNVLIRNDNTVAFVDFGIFGQLTEEQRENLAGFLENLALGNIEWSFRYYARQHVPTEETDLRTFERDAKRILRQWYETSISPFATTRERHMGRFATWMIEAIRRHRLRTNPDVMLLWRALFVLDASSERLSEYFDMMGQVRAFFLEYRPGPIGRVFAMVADPERNAAVLRIAERGPGQLGRIRDKVIRGARSDGGDFCEVVVDESRHAERVNDQQVKLLVWGVLSISLAVFVDGVFPGVAYTVVLTAVAVCILIALLLRR
jgi:ubiquinone biosynthesis protein